MTDESGGPGRTRLGFVRVVREHFAFLEGAGFAVVAEEPTFVRYESPAAFVNVFHGRRSYELGVEFGRWVELDTKRVGQRFHLADVIALEHDLGEVGYQSFTTMSGDGVAAFVPRLAAWAREFGQEALLGERAVFERLSTAPVPPFWPNGVNGIDGPCTDFPRVDAYFYPPVGYRGTTASLATLDLSRPATGDCPTETTVEDGWVHFRLGSPAG